MPGEFGGSEPVGGVAPQRLRQPHRRAGAGARRALDKLPVECHHFIRFTAERENAGILKRYSLPRQPDCRLEICPILHLNTGQDKQRFKRIERVIVRQPKHAAGESENTSNTAGLKMKMPPLANSALAASNWAAG